MKKTLIILVLFLIPFMLFAAGSKDSRQENYLRLTWWGNPARDEMTLKAVSLFTQKNPGVSIDTETVGWGSYWDKLNTQASTNSLPDIIQMDFAYIQQWVSKNQLLELTPYINKTFDASNIPETLLSLGKLDGGIYGIALGTGMPGTCYDPAIVEKAGLPPIDSTKWTLKDFEDISNTIFRNTGIKTLPICPQEPKSAFEVFVRQTGNNFFAADGKSLGFTNDPQMLRNFWEVQLRLLDSGALLAPDIAFVKTSVEEEPFVRGQTWNHFIASNQLVAYTQAAGKPIKMALIPIMPNAKAYGNVAKPTMYFCISSKSANPDLAMKFINFFVNDLAVSDIIQAERGAPLPNNVREHLMAVTSDPVQKEMFAFADLVTQYSIPVGPPDPPGALEVTALFRDMTVQILTKAISVDEAVSKFIAEANGILSVN
jgi:multiple sugar transport system substrate-binding protein